MPVDTHAEPTASLLNQTTNDVMQLSNQLAQPH